MNRKKNLELFFCCFSAVKNTVAASSCSNFPVKLICSGVPMSMFVCLDKSVPISWYRRFL